MIKKRYLIVLSVIAVSVLLGSLLYNSIAQAGKPEPVPDQVEVTNFPLDEEGNLKVSSGPSQVVTVESELNLSYPIFPSYNIYETTSISTGGYRQFYVYWSYKNQTSSARCGIYLVSIVDGIEVMTHYEAHGGGVSWSEWDGTPTNASSRYLVWAPTIKIGVTTDGETEGGWLLVSISLYLRD